MPLGLVLPLLLPRLNRGRTVLASALISLGIEAVQLIQYIVFANGRAVDVNDLIANTIGGLLGCTVLRAVTVRRGAHTGTAVG